MGMARPFKRMYTAHGRRKKAGSVGARDTEGPPCFPSRGAASRARGQTITTLAPHGIQECPISPRTRYINIRTEAKHHCRATAQERPLRDRFQAQQTVRVVERALQEIFSSRESTVVMTSHSLVTNRKRRCPNYPTRLLQPWVASQGDWMACVPEPLGVVAPALRHLETDPVKR